ncbi:MAG: hypothetical protein COA78_03370 [Blastopirellula sp.]|nr:MAG: hypothetical protein COA78_03370 [Blastopirellula sp.]
MGLQEIKEKNAARSPQAPSFLAAKTNQFSPQDLVHSKLRISGARVKQRGLDEANFFQDDSIRRQLNRIFLLKVGK